MRLLNDVFVGEAQYISKAAYNWRNEINLFVYHPPSTDFRLKRILSLIFCHKQTVISSPIGQHLQYSRVKMCFIIR